MSSSKKSKKTSNRSIRLYERKETYLPHEVLDFLPYPADYPKFYNLKKIKREYDGDLIKMGSDRYYTFAKSLNCVFCGIKGSFFAKERGLGETNGYHFNLYAINKDGQEVLMTKDHIVAKSRGGSDSIDNYACACKTCNEEKYTMDFDEFMLIKQNQLALIS